MGMWWCPTVSLNTIKSTPNLQNLLIHAGGAQCSAYISSTGSIAWRSVLLTLPRQEGGRGGSEEAMVRDACCPKEGIKRGTWTSQEDKLLSDYIKAHGLGRWRSLPKNAGLNRCPKSCRLRWLNYLRPGIKRGNIAEEEEELIIKLHNLLGNRWSLIAGRLPGRTDNEIKNYWNTCLRKKASGDISKKHRKPANKKSPDRGLDKEKPTNIIRTRAVRCTRFVYKSEVPTMTPNSLGSSSPSIQSEAELQQSLHPQIACLPPVQFDMDGIFTDYGTQNSPSSNIEDIYMVGSGSNSTDDIDVPLSEHWFDVRGIHDGNMEEEILQYLTEETWDTMLQDVMSSP